MDLNIVYPSPILRERIISRIEQEASDQNESPKKNVQFDETAKQGGKGGRPKKKPKFYVRDSLATRYRRGKPGTRRHQRWMNEMYLNHDWSDVSESETEIDIFELNQEALNRPTFSFVAVYEDNTEDLHEFWYNERPVSHSLDDTRLSSADVSFPTEKPISTSLENEEGFLKEKKKRTPKAPKAPDHMERRYLRIPSKSRKQLKKFSDTLFLKELENSLLDYLEFLRKNDSVVLKLAEDEEEDDFGVFAMDHDGLDDLDGFVSNSTTFSCLQKQGCLDILFQEPVHRLLGHGVAKFYGLKSHSWNDDEDRRWTTVYLASTSLAVPKDPAFPLRKFLSSEI